MDENSYLNREIQDNVGGGRVFDHSIPKPLTKRQIEIENNYQRKLKELRMNNETKQAEHTTSFLCSQEFFDLMQQYRIAPMEDQERVINAFESVKSHINNEYDKLKSDNARMLEALKSFMDLFRDSDMRPEDECHEVAAKIEAAIAKAEGRAEE